MFNTLGVKIAGVVGFLAALAGLIAFVATWNPTMQSGFVGNLVALATYPIPSWIVALLSATGFILSHIRSKRQNGDSLSKPERLRFLVETRKEIIELAGQINPQHTTLMAKSRSNRAETRAKLLIGSINDSQVESILGAGLPWNAIISKTAKRIDEIMETELK